MKLQKPFHQGQQPPTRQAFDRDRLLEVRRYPGRIIVDVAFLTDIESLGEVRVTFNGCQCQAWLEQSRDWKGQSTLSVHLLVISTPGEHNITIEPENYHGIEVITRG